MLTILSKDTTLNVLISISLVFFVGMTLYQVGIFAANGFFASGKSLTDSILVVAVFVGWAAFIVAVLLKAISMYRKIPNTLK